MEGLPFMEVMPQAGRVEWIGFSSGNRAPIEAVEEVEVLEGTGLVGDHHARTGRGKRQVTLMQEEHLAVIGAILGQDVTPEQTRRNILVSGINLLALKKRRFRVGEVVLEGTGVCEPCSRMEENLGPGGWNAMTGHSGITASVITPGTMRVGDVITLE